MSVIKFRNITFEDLDLIYQWFQNPEIHQWYARGKDYSLQEIKEKYSPRILGQEDVPSYIINLDDQEIGFIQYYPFSDNSLPEGLTTTSAKALSMDYKESAGIDLFIGEEDLIGKGFGSNIILAFINEMVPKQYTHIYVDPDKLNIRAIRAYQKCGFEEVTSFKDQRTCLMVFRKK